MLERKRAEARLNRALNELLGTGSGAEEAVRAVEDMEAVLRAIATLVAHV